MCQHKVLLFSWKRFNTQFTEKDMLRKSVAFFICYRFVEVLNLKCNKGQKREGEGTMDSRVNGKKQ